MYEYTSNLFLFYGGIYDTMIKPSKTPLLCNRFTCLFFPSSELPSLSKHHVSTDVCSLYLTFFSFLFHFAYTLPASLASLRCPSFFCSCPSTIQKSAQTFMSSGVGTRRRKKRINSGYHRYMSKLGEWEGAYLEGMGDS